MGTERTESGAGRPEARSEAGPDSAAQAELTSGPQPELTPDPEAAGAEPDPDPDATAGRAPCARRALRAWRHPRLRWPKRIALGLVLLLVLPALGAGIALRVNYAGDPGPGTQTRNRDALWLGHAWIDGRKGDAEVQALAEQLRDTGIRDLYVHAGPLEHDGTLPKSAVSAGGLADRGRAPRAAGRTGAGLAGGRTGE